MSDDAPPSDPFAAKFGTAPQPAVVPSDTVATSAPAQTVSQNPGPATPDLSKMSMQDLQSMVQPSQMPAHPDPTNAQPEQPQPATAPQQPAQQFPHPQPAATQAQQQSPVAAQQFPQQQTPVAAQQFPQQQQAQQFPQQPTQQFQQPNQASVRPVDAATVNTAPSTPSYHGYVEPQITEFVMTQFRGSYAFGSAATLLAPHGQRPATTREDIEQRINDANEAVRRIQREVAMLTNDLNAM